MNKFYIKRNPGSFRQPFELMQRVSDPAETNHFHICYLTIDQAKDFNGETVSFRDENLNWDDVYSDVKIARKKQEEKDLEAGKKLFVIDKKSGLLRSGNWVEE